nr:unnamed protein product [Callosobruchus chinensis]
MSLDGDEEPEDHLLVCAPKKVKVEGQNNLLPGHCFYKQNSSYISAAASTMDPLYDKRAILVNNMSDAETIKIIPERKGFLFEENDTYFGYTVRTATITVMGEQVRVVVGGSPRGGALNGAVKMYDFQGNFVREFVGEEPGSYFGSSILAVDTNNDQVDDLLIARSYHVKLTGSRKPAARFGTAISQLGDIDLDGYQGAVYIYRGSSKGVQSVYDQRLSPSNFEGNFGNVRGFGLGISKGNDIDGNGHNEYQLSLETNVSSINNAPIAIKYCMYYTQKGKIKDIRVVNFKIKSNLDYRVNGKNSFEHTWPSMIDIQPFRISVSAEPIHTEAIALGQSKIEKFVPFSHGCGDDNICQTDISLEANSDKKNIFLGLEKTLNLNIFADNHGEPGYQCLLYLDIPAELDYRNKEKCKRNESLICPFSSSITSTATMRLKFDITSLNPDNETIQVQFEVKCLGKNLIPNKQTFTWQVVTQNSPYIEGKSEPNNLYYGSEDTSDQEITHTFTIGNFGPSPVKLDVTFLLPIVDKEASLFKILSIKGLLNGHTIPCSQVDRSDKKGHRTGNFLVDFVNKSIILDCSQENDNYCVEIFCNGGYLYKSSETATFDIKVNTDLEALGSRIESYASTLIFSASKNPVPLWIYIVGTIIGCLLLLLVIFLLYKCHFFDRRYKEKLNDERLMSQGVETNPGIDNPHENVYNSE